MPAASQAHLLRMPSPIVCPPAIPRQNRATKQAQVAERICEWCKSAISRDAIRCPQCREWESDVIEHRKNAIIKGIGVVFFSLSFFLICFSVWPKSPNDTQENSCWFNKVRDESETAKLAAVLSTKVPNLYTKFLDNCPVFRWQFSLGKFLTSISGWLAVGCLSAFFCMLSSYLRSQVFLKHKTGLYCWFGT